MDATRPVTLTHAWQVLHPPSQPWQQGWLGVGDGHEVYFEQSGHPGAPAALVLHGGPGASSTAHDRRWFDAQHWRVVLMDQRGCGRSRAADLVHANTTAHLVADIEALRQQLGIERWLLLGGSWGSTLALTYAQAHPQRVAALVLRGVFLGSAAESRALLGTLADEVHGALQTGGARARDAAHIWWQHEQQRMAHEGAPPTPPCTPSIKQAIKRSIKQSIQQSIPPPHQPDAAALLAAAHIGVHYARAAWFLREGQLLHDVPRLHGLPGVIVQGQLDRVTPPAAARALHAAWPAARFVEVAAAGHSSWHPATAAALIDHIQALAQTRPIQP